MNSRYSVTVGLWGLSGKSSPYGTAAGPSRSLDKQGIDTSARGWNWCLNGKSSVYNTATGTSCSLDKQGIDTSVRGWNKCLSGKSSVYNTAAGPSPSLDKQSIDTSAWAWNWCLNGKSSPYDTATGSSCFLDNHWHVSMRMNWGPGNKAWTCCPREPKTGVSVTRPLFTLFARLYYWRRSLCLSLFSFLFSYKVHFQNEEDSDTFSACWVILLFP